MTFDIDFNRLLHDFQFFMELFGTVQNVSALSRARF